MNGYTLTCICGRTPEQHVGTDHPFIEKRPDYDPSTWLRGARFDHKQVGPPGEVYITVEDRCLVQLYSSLAGAEVDVVARILRPDGEVIPILKQFFPAATRAEIQNEFDLCEGFLLDIVASTPTAGVRRGAIFADINLIRGTGVNAITELNLIDSYVTSQTGAGWPVVDNYEPTIGEGLLRAVNVANPAAGADWSAAVPAGARWEVQAFNAQLLTSAGVANRQPVIQITDGAGHVLHNSPFSGVQAASLTEQYSAGESEPIANNGNFNITSLPRGCKMLQGWTIGTSTVAIQAADQWSL